MLSPTNRGSLISAFEFAADRSNAARTAIRPFTALRIRQQFPEARRSSRAAPPLRSPPMPQDNAPRCGETRRAAAPYNCRRNTPATRGAPARSSMVIFTASAAAAALILQRDQRRRVRPGFARARRYADRLLRKIHESPMTGRVPPLPVQIIGQHCPPRHPSIVSSTSTIPSRARTGCKIERRESRDGVRCDVERIDALGEKPIVERQDASAQTQMRLRHAGYIRHRQD